MNPYLQYFVYIPLFGLLISLLTPSNKEAWLSKTAFATAGLQFFGAFVFAIFWAYYGFPDVNTRDLSLFRTKDYEFFIDFYFDKVAATYMIVGAAITFMITIYSRFYMHRETGYKRFFNTILFFFLGYNITVLAGNLETLFLGWEILGVSSFLLIAFYRFRYLPVKNAVKVFSIYRIGDVGLILAMWATHHFWHENITFQKLNDAQLVSHHLETQTFIGIFISLMILLAAVAKSAQLPFSSWLPRAMEGPTPSSAIFYGSLSVHMGVFLLLRTYHFWEHQLYVKILIGLIGLSTSIVATGIARVQSSVKSQIAYASIAQIGLIFIEVALGLEKIALLHFAGNAFMRTYQLLVSPSVVSYLIKEQFYNFVPRPLTLEDSFPKRIENSFYILCLKEWNLDSLVYKIYWRPLKSIGRRMDFMSKKVLLGIFVPIYLVGVYLMYHKELLSDNFLHILPITFGLIGLFMVIKSFSERKNPIMSWAMVNMNHMWIGLAIAFNENFDFNEIYLYLSGIFVSGGIGYLVLRKIKACEPDFNLNDYHGHTYRHPRLALIFFLACLGVSGFPITPTFIGEDLIFSHIHEHQYVLAFFVSLSLIVDGLAVIRIYAKLFLGPHSESPKEMAFRSS